MEIAKIQSKANKIFPQEKVSERNAYIKGFIDGLLEASREPDDFYETLAKKLRELWPAGEKDGKYPWRDSVKNLKLRLEFLWKDRNLKGKYTLDDCLMAARRYLSQYENNVTYMQTLKYFIFKQDKIIDHNGKGVVTYKSTFADMLESNPSLSGEFSDDLFESTVSEGELI